MGTGLTILILCFCILAQGFFSGCEMIIISSNKLKLKRLASTKGAKLAFHIINRPRWFLATTSTGTNFFVIISSVVAAAWFENIFGILGEFITIIAISPFLLLIGEIIPRAICQQKATELAPKISRFFWVVSKIISPITHVVFFVSSFFLKITGKDNNPKNQFVTREDLEHILQIPNSGIDFKKQEKKLIRRVFHLTKREVADVMVSLVDVTAISTTSTVKEAKKKISHTGYSRLPVFKDRVDNLIGVIYAFDLIGVSDTCQPIEKFIKKTAFIPEYKKIDELLKLLQKSRTSIAIVVDEYGGTIGIITTEDILEEVVGDISDEHDTDGKKILMIDKNCFRVNARTEIDQVNERLSINLPKENYETVGGFLLKKTGKILQKGETFIYQNIKFTVQQANRRSIQEILIYPKLNN